MTQHGDEVAAEREETRAKFESYFAKSGMRAFHALPLADDDGRVGVLFFESSDPDFLSTAHLEMIKVLAGQATVGAAQRFALPRSAVYRCAATPPGEKAEVYGFGETATLGVGCRGGHRPLFFGSFPIAAAYR